VEDLRREFGILPEPISGGAPRSGSEAAVQAAVRAEAGRLGIRLFRNNCGAFTDPRDGRLVRYGLANDSAALSAAVKSADLVGVRPLLITEEYLGATVGQFVSRECKAADWVFTGTDRELAQLHWASALAALGADACFVCGPGSF
jgi:hypothetical protein